MIKIELIFVKIFSVTLQHKTYFPPQSAFLIFFDGENSVILKATLLRNG